MIGVVRMVAQTTDKSRFNTMAPKWINSLLVIGIGYALATVSLKALPAPELQVSSVDPSTISNTGQKTAVDKMQLHPNRQC